MSKVKINLFGERWKLTKLNVDSDLYVALKKRAVEIEEPWPSGLLSANFFDTAQFVNHINLEDLGGIDNTGLLNTYKNQIEIWYGGKKIKKIKVGDLSNDFLLFPLYQIKKAMFTYDDLEVGIYIEQYEIGLVGCYEGVVNGFELENLVFSKLMVQKSDEVFEVLDSINYGERGLRFNDQKIDTLITKQVCFEIKGRDFHNYIELNKWKI